MEKRNNMVFKTMAPNDEKIVSMTEHKGILIIATERALYEFTCDSTLKPIKFKAQGHAPQNPECTENFNSSALIAGNFRRGSQQGLI